MNWQKEAAEKLQKKYPRESNFLRNLYRLSGTFTVNLLRNKQWYRWWVYKKAIKIVNWWFQHDLDSVGSGAPLKNPKYAKHLLSKRLARYQERVEKSKKNA